MEKMPQIQKFMTQMPQTIGQDIPLKTAIQMMRELSIRHLPVQYGGKLVGVISDRDLKLASFIADEQKLTVEDVMTPDPYTAAPDAPLDRVVHEMAERKYGCAIIQQADGKVVGIFTAVDGLRVLGDTLGACYKS